MHIITAAAFFPGTLGEWAAVIAAIASPLAALLGYVNRKRISEVHVLVNSRLDSALVQIADLKTQRDIAQSKVPNDKTS